MKKNHKTIFILKNNFYISVRTRMEMLIFIKNLQE